MLRKLALRPPLLQRGIPAVPRRNLNRLLVEPGECSSDSNGRVVARLPRDDPRSQHVRDVLRSANGDTVRAGILDGGATDVATVSVDEAGSLQLDLGSCEMLTELREEARPQVDLLLAMPRPRQFARLLPHIASLGVGTLFVTRSLKSEKSYFSSHLLRAGNEAQLRAALVEGLAQAGDTAVPRVHVQRSMRALLRDLGDGGGGTRLLCHPQRDGAPRVPLVSQVPLPRTGSGRVLLAVGPDGGWAEPEELDLLREHRFEQVTLGRRTLRTETAVVALLAIVQARLQEPRVRVCVPARGTSSNVEHGPKT